MSMEEMNAVSQSPNGDSIVAEESQDVISKEVIGAPGFDFQEMRTQLDAHFLNLRNLIKYTKEKDTNVNKLNVELQKYRDGIEPVLFKSIALALISFREDCKKSIRDMQNYKKQVADIEKLLRYLVLDYEDLLMNIGLESVDDEYRYQGKSLALKHVDFKVFDAVIVEEHTSDIPVQDIVTAEDFLRYLQFIEAEIKKMLQNNAVQDQIIGKYIQQASAYENGVWNIVLHPVLRKLIGCFEKTKATVETIKPTLTEDNCNQVYIDALDLVSSDLGELLVECRVFIEPVVETQYDPKKHRILKMIPTEDETLNGRIANVYSDCYTMDSKVIYPAKIDILKK